MANTQNDLFNFLITTNLPAPYTKIHLFERNVNYVSETHHHAFLYHLNYVVDGELDLYIYDKCITIYKNQFFVIPPAVSHKIISKNGYKQMGVDAMLSVDDRNIISMLKAHFSDTKIALNVPLPLDSFDEVYESLKSPLPINITSFINMYEKVILDAIKIKIKAKNTFSKKLSEIIMENDTFYLTLKDICRITNYSKTQIERLAKKELGCGVSAYLNNIRLNEICTLLQETEMPMAQIAEKVGLYDASHLTTFFKRYMGITPLRFRKNHKEHIE